MIYILIIVLLLFMSFRYDVCGKRRGRDQWYIFFLVVFVLIAGLRWRLGVDTPYYIQNFYYSTPKLDHLSITDIQITKPLWILLNSFVLTYIGKFYVVQLIHAAFINILFFKYIRRHSDYIFTCLFFYFIFMYTNQNMEEMKASMSVAICLYANDYIMEKKWIRAYLLYIFASLFHVSAYLLFITPLFLLLRFNKWGLIALALSFFMGYWLQMSIGDYVTIFDMADESIDNRINVYLDNERYLDQKGNIFYFIVRIIPVLLYALVSLKFLKSRNGNHKLLQLEPFLFIGLVFLMMQMSMQIFYRLVHFYSIYFVLFFSETFIFLIREKSRGQRGFAYVKSFVLFLPFILSTLYGYRDKYVRYYPYSSVIERSVDRDREIHYSNCYRPSPNKYQY